MSYNIKELSFYGKIRGEMVEELLSFVCNRIEILETLAESPLEKRDLVDEVGASRSTVYRCTRKLEELGLVEDRVNGLYLTHSGRIVLKTFDEARRKISIVPEYGDILRHLPSSLDMDYAIFSTGNITKSSRSSPIKPVEDLQRLVLRGRQIRGFSPVLLPQYVDLFYGKICEGVDVELVLERKVIEELEANFPDKLKDSISQENFTLWNTSESLHIGLILINEAMGLMIYGEGGEIKAFIEVEDEDCLEWGRCLYRELKNSAIIIPNK